MSERRFIELVFISYLKSTLKLSPGIFTKLQTLT